MKDGKLGKSFFLNNPITLNNKSGTTGSFWSEQLLDYLIKNKMSIFRREKINRYQLIPLFKNKVGANHFI